MAGGEQPLCPRGGARRPSWHEPACAPSWCPAGTSGAASKRWRLQPTSGQKGAWRSPRCPWAGSAWPPWTTARRRRPRRPSPGPAPESSAWPPGCATEAGR
eukprot:1653838-Alexandrium_andersonii.AAC.1